MSEEKNKENKSVTKKAEGNTSSGKSISTSKITFIVSTVLIIALSVAFVFINDQLNKIEQKLNQSNIKNNNTVLDSNNKIKETLSRFASVQNKLLELESKQDELSYSISQPQEQQIHVNKDYALAEIEHLLIIASYNLQLDHNVVTALSAMESADARLAGLTDPAVLSVREQLISDMNVLRSINQADLSGMALFLSDLINRVDELPLKENMLMEQLEIKTKPVEEQVEGVKHFLALVFKELKSLVVITHDENVSKVRLLPDEVYFLHANLKLELANARFAVFNRDTENLHASINNIHLWLNDYFDLTDAAVRNIYDSLSSIKKTELIFPDVDINSSLESVRALSRYQDESNALVDEEGLMRLQ
ncbi:MAG TPA: hypothetical protein EYQ42_03980 [Thiotrichaceae bacterium]|jgi:uncharacterized protein HemX|nr:hypothetical protein [Thiotrichaceae bacterium]HIM07126.1 hypothetical protein [Gammaproteobacteria bacterium]